MMDPAIRDPAWLLILDGRLGWLDCAQGRDDSASSDVYAALAGDNVMPGVKPNVVTELGEFALWLPLLSSNGLRVGSSGTSSCSERTSEGPNDVAAKGERMEGRDLREGPKLLVGDAIPDEEALTISALTEPMTCRTTP